MTALLSDIRSKIGKDCLASGGLNKDGCKVVMTGVPEPRLVVDFDKPGSPLAAPATRCDYLLVAERNGRKAHGWVVVLELKRGPLRADQVVGQLRAGASAAEKLVPRDEALTLGFRPIAAFRGISKAERQELKKKANAIRFHGQSEPVRLMSCGGGLASQLG